jgi:predicted nucleic acid-binding protein
MSKLVFVDTNVLVYLRDGAAIEKKHIANNWIERLGAVSALRINLQVLNEYAAVVLKREPRIAVDHVRDTVRALSVWGARHLEASDVALAWDVRRTLGYQWFDCLLVAAASNDGCDVFLSEDMGDGDRFGRLVVVDPFRHHPDRIL